MSHRSPNSGIVFDTRDLSRRSGSIKVVNTEVAAPDGLESGVTRVPAGSPVGLELRFESVIEGVLVSGVADVTLHGNCSRCLDEIEMSEQIDIQELFLFPGKEDDDEDACRIENDELDLEPVLRDAVVLNLPFSPLCRPDCAGLCPTCGASYNDQPEHNHGDKIDPRWEQLTAWLESDTDNEETNKE